MARTKQSSKDTMATSGGGALARAMEHRARQSCYLRDLEEQGVSFYSLSAKQMI
jgi:hypothetical protein